jgi:hypothetical protein
VFWLDKRTNFFQMTLASLLISICLQLVQISFQHRKRGARRVAFEALPVLFGMKPTIDAFRVAGGEKGVDETLADTLIDMTVTKGIELFAEAIPAEMIQFLAIATSDDKTSTAAWMSLGTSIVTAGFICSSISYDFDVSPEKRNETPDFYGYIPASAKKRTLIFLVMWFMSGLNLLIRSLTLVLLGLIGGKSLAFGFLGETGWKVPLTLQ